VQHAGSAAFDSPDLFTQTREVRGKYRRCNLDVSMISTHGFGVGRGVTGRLFSFAAAGRAFTFGKTVRFTFARGVAFTFARGTAFTFARGVAFTLAGLAFTLARFAFAVLFVLPFAFSFVFFGFGFFGLFSLLLAAEFVFRFSTGSSGVTFSGVSPSLVTRLMSIATV